MASYIANATDLPWCDADTGFGEAVNVSRCVKVMERAGVAAIHIEDQVFPRCGHLSGKQLIPAEQMVRKIKTAVLSREDRISSSSPAPTPARWRISTRP